MDNFFNIIYKIFNVMKKNKLLILVLLIIIVISIIKINNNNKIINNNNKIINNNDEKKNTNDEKKNTNEKIIILFYADWCGWSQKFLPIWKDFTKECDNLNIQYKTIECSDNKKCFNSKYNIEGFPTILLEVNNKIIEYNGDRTVKSLLNFVKNE